MDTTLFYCKCSICFENDSEMEFINCGDQYCFTCLERYVEYWIKEGSWGLMPSELSCPVCGLEMLNDDWMPYVSSKTMSLWHKLQVKRAEDLKDKSKIIRSCPICNHSQPIIGPRKSFQDLILIGDCLAKTLDSTSFEDWRAVFGLENVFDLFQEDELFSDLADFSETCQDLFDEFLNLIDKLRAFDFFKEEESELIRLLMEFGRIFLYLISEEIPESSLLIDLQLNFQSTFPFGHCDACNLDFCLPCQYPDWFHPNHSKLTRPDGTKQCPRCFVAIEKDVDGCNEMRCNYCAMKFCWECGRKWSKECGIYKCKRDNQKPQINTNVYARDPEIGVPNVRIIHNGH